MQQNKLGSSLLLCTFKSPDHGDEFSSQIPYSREDKFDQMPHICPTSAPPHPPPLRLNIDRCIIVMHICMYVCNMNVVCVYVCRYHYVSIYLFIHLFIYLAGFSKRLSTVKGLVSQLPPCPNFPVSSSYKNRNCLNIRTRLDILDNRHPRK